jgi:hypothetical protein
MTMWVYPDWNLWAGARPPQARPSTRDRVLARVRHASFTPDLAEKLVTELSRRQVRLLWRDTTRLLGSPIEDDLRLKIVLLREQLLDRL